MLENFERASELRALCYVENTGWREFNLKSSKCGKCAQCVGAVATDERALGDTAKLIIDDRVVSCFVSAKAGRSTKKVVAAAGN